MIVVLDTETTGLPNEPRASVIEVGAVCIDADGFEVASFSSLVRPLHELGDWARPALAVHGIRRELLEAAPEAPVVWDALLGWMRLHKPVTQVLAYHVAFDREMMERTFELAQHLPWGPCLMIAAAQHIHGPKRQRLGLKKAADHFKVPMSVAHRAVEDARTAAAVGAAIQRERNGATA